ncbi:methyltransferase domain-containing protein [Corynascus novoguineensis]|uniref:Methyltransferase domain-containing protein n=1 Tax=Corynascus novoguineensis TaxID=1126955 RepID=A0AAN7D228_9PEZI|nr:methyltransferase domain-containing protein [Corynascus novoguineensis]
MLPTPSTSHVPYARVYEPAEDSFLLLDTLSSATETAFLAARFPSPSVSLPSPSEDSHTGASATITATPLVLEVGPGSGVVLAFLTAHAESLFSRRDILTLGVDVNRFACAATSETVAKAVAEAEEVGNGYHLGTAQGDLATAVRPGTVDVLVFNPPYVPTPELPPTAPIQQDGAQKGSSSVTAAYEEDSRLLALSYAGGKDGMEVTDRLIEALPGVLSDLGVAYLLLCAQNKPDEVKDRIRTRLEGGGKWRAETVGTSGRQAGWEKLQIVRIWRE